MRRELYIITKVIKLFCRILKGYKVNFRRRGFLGYDKVIGLQELCKIEKG